VANTIVSKTIPYPACDENIVVTGALRLTSERTPDNRSAVVFVEFNQDALDRHAATHLSDEEAAA